MPPSLFNTMLSSKHHKQLRKQLAFKRKLQLRKHALLHWQLPSQRGREEQEVSRMRTLPGRGERRRLWRGLQPRLRRPRALVLLQTLELVQALASRVQATYKHALPLQEPRLADCLAQLVSHKCVLLLFFVHVTLQADILASFPALDTDPRTATGTADRYPSSPHAEHREGCNEYIHEAHGSEVLDCPSQCAAGTGEEKLARS